jgi:hypothetical protein
MLELAISDDINSKAETIALTNCGRELRDPGWPQDSESQLIAYAPRAQRCHVVWVAQLSQDIAQPLEALD